MYIAEDPTRIGLERAGTGRADKAPRIVSASRRPRAAALAAPGIGSDVLARGRSRTQNRAGPG